MGQLLARSSPMAHSRPPAQQGLLRSPGDRAHGRSRAVDPRDDGLDDPASHGGIVDAERGLRQGRPPAPDGPVVPSGRASGTRPAPLLRRGHRGLSALFGPIHFRHGL
jgi:hypothetical protein